MVLLAIGLIIFTLGDIKVKPDFEPIGVLLVVVFVCVVCCVVCSAVCCVVCLLLLLVVP